MRRAPLFTIALLASSLFTLLVARSPSSEPAPTYVGSETCKGCHEAQWNSFQKTPHGMAEMDSAVVGHAVGCEACHGPGSLHAAAAGDRSNPGFASIRNFKSMSAEDASGVCQGCHVASEQLYWDKSKHAQRGVSCIQCHDPHGTVGGAAHSALLRKPDVNQTCFQCHKDKRVSMSRSAHMPLREGSMTCADCHNPHGSSGPKMIRAASNNELCTTCHADKRGPFLWEHAPVRENCLNCHQPHGANNAKVLASKEPYLCQRCHVATRHPSTLYDLPDLKSNRLLNRSCTNCHANIHGSNHPSGKTFLR